MIIEYYKDFEKTISYKYLTKKCVREFDEYLKNRNIPLHEAYDEIFSFSESCPTSRKTQRVYRTRLRRFLEYIYDEENITREEEDTIKIGGGE